jgi:hypothetical protein
MLTTDAADRAEESPAAQNLASSLEEALSARLFWLLALVCAGSYLFMLFGVPLLFDGLYTNDMNQNLAWAHRYLRPHALEPSPSAEYQYHSYAGLEHRTV